MSRKPILEVCELVSQTQQCFARILHVSDLCRQATMQPFAHCKPKIEIRIRKCDVRRVSENLQLGKQRLATLRAAKTFEEDSVPCFGLLHKVHVAPYGAHVGWFTDGGEQSLLGRALS